MKNIIIVLFLAAGIGLLYLSQKPRLDAYDAWYMCMYEDWNQERCDLKIYGKINK